jgi:hypothetical protein
MYRYPNARSTRNVASLNHQVIYISTFLLLEVSWLSAVSALFALEILCLLDLFLANFTFAKRLSPKKQQPWQ